jgi:hypothetical protein
MNILRKSKLINSIIDVIDDWYLSIPTKIWFIIKIIFLYPIELIQDLINLYSD